MLVHVVNQQHANTKPKPATLEKKTTKNMSKSKMNATKRSKKRNRQLNPVKMANPLNTITRTLARLTSIQLESWQVSNGIQYSADYRFPFKVTDFPGFSEMAAISDHYKVINVTHRITKHFRVGDNTDTGTANPRSLTLLSSYDKDGGNINPLDILSRSNMKAFTVTLNQPTLVLTGQPAYLNQDKRVVTGALLDAQTTTHPEFNSFTIVAFGNGIGTGASITLEVIQYVTIQFQGLR